MCHIRLICPSPGCFWNGSAFCPRILLLPPGCQHGFMLGARVAVCVAGAVLGGGLLADQSSRGPRMDRNSDCWLQTSGNGTWRLFTASTPCMRLTVGAKVELISSRATAKTRTRYPSGGSVVKLPPVRDAEARLVQRLVEYHIVEPGVVSLREPFQTRVACMTNDIRAHYWNGPHPA